MLVKVSAGIVADMQDLQIVRTSLVFAGAYVSHICDVRSSERASRFRVFVAVMFAGVVGFVVDYGEPELSISSKSLVIIEGIVAIER
jgi:hypothetical protein